MSEHSSVSWRLTDRRQRWAKIRRSIPYPFLQDFGDEVVRGHLGPAAWTGFCRIMATWQVDSEESRQLLTLGPTIRIDELNPPELTEEQLFRISYLIGIFKALHMLHGDRLADEWVKLLNSNEMFSEQV